MHPNLIGIAQAGKRCQALSSCIDYVGVLCTTFWTSAAWLSQPCTLVLAMSFHVGYRYCTSLFLWYILLPFASSCCTAPAERLRADRSDAGTSSVTWFPLSSDILNVISVATMPLALPGERPLPWSKAGPAADHVQSLADVFVRVQCWSAAAGRAGQSRTQNVVSLCLTSTGTLTSGGCSLGSTLFLRKADSMA